MIVRWGATLSQIIATPEFQLLNIIIKLGNKPLDAIISYTK